MNNSRNQEYLKKFGRNLRKIRRAKNISQEKLSLQGNITPSQVGRIERGEINPTITIIKIIAQALEVEIDLSFRF